MENYSADIKSEFEKQFKAIEDNKKVLSNKQFKFLLIAFIIVFAFVLTGTIFAYKNYIKVKSNQDGQTNVIQKVIVKEN